jgi:uncharacterized RDD family membrane protein YckC
MAEDPNETAQRAFGDAGPMAPPTPPAAPPARETYAPPTPRDVPARELADWWTRAGAFVLDQLVIAGAVIAAVVVALLFVDDPAGDTARIVAYAIALPFGFLYAPLLMARAGARNGQTLGKQLVGIRVVQIDGAPVTFWTGILRTVVGQQLLIAVTFYIYAVVDYLWPLRDPQNQALHDKIAKTWVLRTAAQVQTDPAWLGSPSPSPAPAPPQPGEQPSQVWLPPQAPGA